MFVTLFYFLFRVIICILAFLAFISLSLFILEFFFPSLRIFKVHPWNEKQKSDKDGKN